MRVKCWARYTDLGRVLPPLVAVVVVAAVAHPVGRDPAGC